MACPLFFMLKASWFQEINPLEHLWGEFDGWVRQRALVSKMSNEERKVYYRRQRIPVCTIRCLTLSVTYPCRCDWRKTKITNDYDLYIETRFEPRHDKTNKMSVRPANTQISLGIRPIWSESSLCAQWVAKDQSFLHADNEDSDQTGRIWVFAGRTATLLVLSCRGKIWWKHEHYDYDPSLEPSTFDQLRGAGCVSLVNKICTRNEPRHEKTCFCYMRTTKAQISLRIRAVWSAPLLFAAWIV